MVKNVAEIKTWKFYKDISIGIRWPPSNLGHDARDLSTFDDLVSLHVTPRRVSQRSRPEAVSKGAMCTRE